MTKTARLGDVLDIRKGKKAPKVFEAPVAGSIPYIQIDEVRGVTPTKFAIDPNPVVATADDVCIVWDGANAGTVGYGVSGAVGSTVARMRLKKRESWDSRFLGRLLESKFKQLNQEAQGRGATIPHIDKKRLEGIEFPEIPVSEQRRIAAILDKADAVRRKREAAIGLSDEFLRSVFVEMFGDPVVNRKGLRKRPLREFGKVVTGNTPPRSDPGNFGNAIEWIKSDNISTDGHLLTRAAEGLSERGKTMGRVVPKGSILVTCIAGSPASIGRAAISDRDVAFNQQINAIVPWKGISLYFLYAQFLIGKSLVLKSSTNSMKGMISKSAFQEIEFLCPDPADQEKFGRLFEKHIQATSALQEALSCANALLGALSQRAFRGEL